MKQFFTLLLVLLIACSESENTLNENITSTPSFAPGLEVQTVHVKLLSRSFIFYDNLRKRQPSREHPPVLVLPDPEIEMITPVGVPTQVYRVLNGHLIQEQIIAQEPLYHLVWCQLSDKIVLMNVLENRIRYIPYEDAMDMAYENISEAQKTRLDELLAEEQANWEEWKKENDENKVTPEEMRWDDKAYQRWHREINPQPFDIHHHTGDFGDEIEVVIKHTFTLQSRNSAVEMIFVDVKRNISRPHITYRGTLFQ